MLRNSIWTIIVLFFLSSCSVEKFCNSRYPPVTSDSVWVKIDTIPIHDTLFIGSESIGFDTGGFLPENIVFHTEKKKGRLTASVDIRKGKLTFKCVADSLQEIIDRQTILINTFSSKKEVKMIECDKDHKSKFNYFCTYFFWIALIMFIIRFVLKYFTGK